MLTPQDYYPFGMLMPGRYGSANTSGVFTLGSSDYRYGMQGQEKDDQVYGEGNTTTAEHWQYDTRLGRRWNTDPVVKPWISPYATFSLNPIVKVDPNGDDDYFDIYGNYLGNDGSKTSNNIRVITSGLFPKNLFTMTAGKFHIDANIGQQNSSLLADFTYNLKGEFRDVKSTWMLQTITSHYGQQVGIDKPIKADYEEGSVAFTSGDQININVDGGKISPLLNDFNNLKNTLVHEKKHASDNKDKSFRSNFFTHAEVYVDQMNSPTWSLSTGEFRAGMSNNFAYYLYGAMSNDLMPTDVVQNLIDNYNSLNGKDGYRITMGYRDVATPENLIFIVKTPRATGEIDKKYFDERQKIKPGHH